jgi:hypothetical protein
VNPAGSVATEFREAHGGLLPLFCWLSGFHAKSAGQPDALQTLRDEGWPPLFGEAPLACRPSVVNFEIVTASGGGAPHRPVDLIEISTAGLQHFNGKQDVNDGS